MGAAALRSPVDAVEHLVAADSGGMPEAMAEGRKSEAEVGDQLVTATRWRLLALPFFPVSWYVVQGT